MIWMGIADCGAAEKLQFNRDIRPILSENCLACHGPDRNRRKAKLRLDVRESALEKEAIKPGKPDDSGLVRRIFSTKEDEQMPPPDSRKQLTPGQRELLKRWIAEGAEYQPHWSYIPPVRPEGPRTRLQGWVKNPVDAFVLHDLEARNLKPSPEADRRTLLRRLSLDLTGLPPTPEEIEGFLKDRSPAAYERQVDRLLNSPHYGERMAVPWLDLARFADTVGYHGDQNVNVFPYREYVINAFNENKPFDQFTIEQLAGDLLPHPTTEQIVATGFNRLNMVTREGGAQAGEYLAKYGADRVRTVSTTWLGSTMGCCECHDHKYDPFSTRDFYSLKAFFADIKQWGVYSDYGYTPNPDLKGWSNDHPFPPEITVESPYLLKRMERIENRMSALATTAVEKLRAGPGSPVSYEQWHQRSLEFLQQWPSGWASPAPGVGFASAKTNAAPATPFSVKTDSSILFTEKTTNEVELTLPLSAGWLAAIRLELLPCAEQDGRIPMAAHGTTITLSTALKSPDTDKAATIAFYHGDADYKQERYVNGSAVVGLRNSWTPSREHDQSLQTAVWLVDSPRAVKTGDVLTVRLGKGLAGCLRLSVSPFAAPDPLKSGGAFTRALSSSRHGSIHQVFLASTAADGGAFAEYKKIHREWLECRGGKSPTVVTEAWKPAVTKVLARGNWQDENGEIVQPAVPHFLPQISNPDGRRLTRLDLARWLVSRDNPLTARTEVNRLWKQFFGAGLAPVLDDLGAQGEWPVHPELLDWLAVEFRDNGWNVKQIVKTMVMSATYRQSSNPSPAVHELDPANRLLASQSPRRLEAEFVRDNALFIAGLLNEDLGGPSAHPYQPAGYYANIQFPDRDYQPELDDRQYRRGLYAHWQRTFLQPMLVAFDAPAREECTAIRNLSNSPQQALALLNDPTFVEAARVFAAKVLSSRTGDERRLDLVYERALARPIKSGERKSLARFLALQREYYQAHAAEAAKLMHIGAAAPPKGLPETEVAAWTQVCRVVLDLHETITKY